jgi:molecular chaperone GrpE
MDTNNSTDTEESSSDESKLHEDEALEGHENTAEKKDSVDDRISKKVSDTYAENELLQTKYLRALADIDNLRKRSIREREEAVIRTRSQLIEDLLPAIDAFKLGLNEASKVDPDGPVFSGFNMAVNQLESIMAEYGLVTLDPTGEAFDPSLHDAIRHEESESEDGTVLQTIRLGFRLGETLLRPASVVVAKSKS